MSMKPCREALVWLKQFRSLRTAWDECTRPDWLVWYLHKSGRLTRAFCTSFAACCRQSVTDGDPKMICDDLAARVANTLDLVLCGQWMLETSFVAIDFATRQKRADIERIRQCEFIRDLIPNPFP